MVKQVALLEQIVVLAAQPSLESLEHYWYYPLKRNYLMMKELVGSVGDAEAGIVDWLNFVNHNQW